MSAIPRGYCQCGCGGKTNVSVQDHPRFGWIKGQPFRYMQGHNNRGRHLKSIRYLEEDRGYGTPCWIWQLRIRDNGYGSASVNRKPYPAHRLYWENRNGQKVPDGLVLDHLCRQRACVNPDHLELVTHPENCRRGLGTKLTAAQVEAIRASRDTNSHIAQRFGISRRHVRDIRLGRKWKEGLITS
jgi:hypothetical protein